MVFDMNFEGSSNLYKGVSDICADKKISTVVILDKDQSELNKSLPIY